LRHDFEEEVGVTPRHDQRAVHFVGTVPSETVTDAVSRMLESAGPLLRSIPDGEPGDRKNWIVSVIQSFRDHPDLELSVDGDFTDYARAPRFRIRDGHELKGDTLRFGLADNAHRSWPIVQALCRDHGRADLPLQVDVPGDLDMTYFTLGPESLQHRPTFAEATANEIRDVHRLLGDRVVFQLSTPVAMVITATAPSDRQPAVAHELTQPMADLVATLPEGTRVGVHFCHGDLGHVALGGMDTTTPFVLLANALVEAWPEGRRLEYVHAPLAAGTTPPPLDERFYAPLRELALPADTRFIAGLAHEDQSLEDQQRALALTEDALGRRVDVATTCGLGRRSITAANAAMERTVALAAT
jgi:hypothetical protein